MAKSAKGRISNFTSKNKEVFEMQKFSGSRKLTIG